MFASRVDLCYDRGQNTAAAQRSARLATWKLDGKWGRNRLAKHMSPRTTQPARISYTVVWTCPIITPPPSPMPTKTLHQSDGGCEPFPEGFCSSQHPRSENNCACRGLLLMTQRPSSMTKLVSAEAAHNLTSVYPNKNSPKVSDRVCIHHTLPHTRDLLKPDPLVQGRARAIHIEAGGGGACSPPKHHHLSSPLTQPCWGNTNCAAFNY